MEAIEIHKRNYKVHKGKYLIYLFITFILMPFAGLWVVLKYIIDYLSKGAEFLSLKAKKINKELIEINQRWYDKFQVPSGMEFAYPIIWRIESITESNFSIFHKKSEDYYYFEFGIVPPDEQDELLELEEELIKKHLSKNICFIFHDNILNPEGNMIFSRHKLKIEEI